MDVGTSAYLAGLIDGEGYITLHRHNLKSKYRWFQFKMGIVNTNLPVLLWAQSLFPQLKSQLRQKAESKKQRDRREYFIVSSRPCYELVWYGWNAAEVVQSVLPYLKIKKAEAEICLVFQQTFKKQWNRRPTDAERNQLADTRQAFVEKVVALRKVA